MPFPRETRHYMWRLLNRRLIARRGTHWHCIPSMNALGLGYRPPGPADTLDGLHAPLRRDRDFGIKNRGGVFQGAATLPRKPLFGRAFSNSGITGGRVG